MTHLLKFTSRMLLTCLFAFLCSPYSFAKSEQDVKAAYLYNFLKFIYWPNEADIKSFNLCVLGKDSVNEKLKPLGQRTIREKDLNVVTIGELNNIEAKDCHILFIGQSEEKFLKKIFSKTESAPTLTISGIDKFSDEGGIIGFIKLGNVIRFEINLKEARSKDISISSKLLELANKVVQ